MIAFDTFKEWLFWAMPAAISLTVVSSLSAGAARFTSPYLGSLFPRKPFSREHDLLRFSQPHQNGKPIRASPGPDGADVDVLIGDDSVLGGNNQVAGKKDPKPPARQ